MGTTNLDVRYWKAEEDVEEEASSLKCSRTPPIPSELPGIHDDVGDELKLQSNEEEEGVLCQSDRSIYFDRTDGTEVNNGTGGVKSNGVDPSVSEKKLVDGESDLTTNAVDILKGADSESTNGTSGMSDGVVDISVGEKTLENGESELTPNGVDITDSVAIETNSQNHKNLKVDEQPGLHLSHPIKPSANGSAVDKPNHGLVEESIQEVAEWDVERVIEEQETHDLFCPNCHSCITKRVILRKRKRKPQNIPNGFTKREKPDLGQSTSPAINNQVHDTDVHGLDSTPHSGDTTQERVEDPEVFRCLSCFSFFIPSVATFKSFWKFGNKGEGARVQDYQDVPARVTPIRQGGDQVQYVEEAGNGEFMSHYPPNHQNNEVSSETPLLNKSSIQPANDRASERQENGINYIDSSVTSVRHEVVKTGGEETPHGAVIKNKRGGDQVQHMEEVGNGELMSHYPPNHQNNEVSSETPLLNKSSIQPANDGASERQENGIDYVDFSITSVRHEVVKTGVEETPHGAVIKNKRDDVNNTFTPLSTTYPPIVDSHVNEQTNFSSKNFWHDDQNGHASSTSISVHRVETRVDTNTRIDGGHNAIQDQGMGNLLNSLADMEKTFPYGNNGVIINQQGAQLPGSFNAKLDEFRKDIQGMSLQEGLLPHDIQIGVGKDLDNLPMSTNSGKDVIVHISPEVPQNVQRNDNGPIRDILISRQTEYGASQQVVEATVSNKWDILKSIVYGGLVESITSLAVVSSAAGGDATTLNIVALGLANLFGGLFIIVHNLVEMKNEPYIGDTDPNTTTGRYQELDRYEELLGKRRNFALHAIVAVLSYLIFGLIAPVTYGFSFRKTDNKEYKLIAVAAAALICIIVLAVVKTYVRKPPKAYSNTVLRYLCIGLMSSGVSYVAGTMIRRLLENLGVFDSTVVDPVSPPSGFLESMATKSSWASY